MADANLGNGAPDGQGSGAGGGQQQQQQQSPTGGGQQQQQQPAAGAGAGGQQQARQYTYTEDRSDWIPRHRLNETSGKLTAAEQRAQAAETALEAERKRVAALAGVTPQDPKQQQTDEVRAAMLEMFPQLKSLEGLTQEQLGQVFEAAQAARQAASAGWERHALGMFNNLDAEAAKSLGTEKLTPTQQKGLRRAYREEAAQCVEDRKVAMQRGERQTLETIATDNDFVARHERGDATLVTEFVKAFLADWLEPARRSVQAAQERRTFRPVPRGERTRQLPAEGAQKVNLNNKEEFKKALLSARGTAE